MTHKIPFGDLRRQHTELKGELEKCISHVLDSGWFILGKQVENFENNFAEYCGKSYGVGVGNATDALFLCLKAQDIGRGDEVITVANTAIPTCSAIVASGARPVLVDAGEDYLIDAKQIEEAITPRTRAIIPVHLYGKVCDMNKIFHIAHKRDIKVIEDCAQAHGSKYRGLSVPIMGLGCFSFYPSKNLGACGDGGMIVTNNNETAEKLKLIRNYGQPKTYVSTTAGYNSRLDEMQAAILNLKLKHLDKWNKRRNELADIYDSELENIVQIPNPSSSHGSKPEHVYHLYVISSLLPACSPPVQRDALKDYLAEKGIETKVHYPVPIHLQPGFANLGYKEGDFPNSERFSKQILSLPMYPELKNEEVHYICKKIKEFRQS